MMNAQQIAEFVGLASAAELGQVIAEALAAAEVDGKLEVEFSKTHVEITSSIDRDIVLGGDVRDGKVSLKAGKTDKRKLTKEGHGFVSIDGAKYRTDQALEASNA